MKSYGYIKKLIAKINFPRYALAIILAILLGIVGTVFLHTSHAATNVVATEPETGTIAAPAAQVTDATASAGKAVKFGAVSSGGTTTWGWQLTTSNTGLESFGINKTTLPVYAGSCSPASGTTISNVQITCQLDLRGKTNITLDHVWLHPTGGLSQTDILYLGDSNTVKNSDIDGLSVPTSSPPRAGISATASNFTIQNVQITKVEVGIYMDEGSGNITHTYISADLVLPSFHIDGFTRRSGTGAVTIDDSSIYAPSSTNTTGAFFLQDTWSLPIDNVTVKNSLLGGNGYVMALENNHSTSVGLSVNNVRLDPTGYGPGETAGTITYHQWINVYRYNASDPINTTDGGAKGAVVNQF